MVVIEGAPENLPLYESEHGSKNLRVLFAMAEGSDVLDLPKHTNPMNMHFASVVLRGTFVLSQQYIQQVYVNWVLGLLPY
jgi:hypothetical protein